MFQKRREIGIDYINILHQSKWWNYDERYWNVHCNPCVLLRVCGASSLVGPVKFVCFGQNLRRQNHIDQFDREHQHKTFFFSFGYKIGGGIEIRCFLKGELFSKDRRRKKRRINLFNTRYYCIIIYYNILYTTWLIQLYDRHITQHSWWCSIVYNISISKIIDDIDIMFNSNIFSSKKKKFQSLHGDSEWSVQSTY